MRQARGMTGLLVPGYDVDELLGYGSGGEVWRAREQATGAPVALKRLRPPADLATRDRVRRAAAVLAGVDHPHVLRLRSVVGSGESLVLVLDLATGGSLARLLAARGGLTPGEVVTIAVPLAQALAHVHAQGLVHGDVTPANVLFTEEGRPVLSDLGLARLVGGGRPGGEPGAADDVHGLAATSLAALGADPAHDPRGVGPGCSGGGAELARVLIGALAPDPDDRPRADELAAAVFASAPARPVKLRVRRGEAGRPAGPGPVTPAAAAPDTPAVTVAATATRSAVTGSTRASVAHPPSRGRGHRRRRPPAARRQRSYGRRALVMALFAITVAALLLSGVLPAGPGADSLAAPGAEPRVVAPPAAAPVGAGSPRWAATLAALDATRARAFEVADPARLSTAYAPGAPALRRDRALVGRLARAGLRTLGLRPTTLEVEQLEQLEQIGQIGQTGQTGQRGRWVRLHVEDVLPAYEIVDSTGAVVQERPGRGRVRWAVTLERVGRRWLFYDVERA